MKYYLDEDISPKVAGLLIKHGINAASAHETGMIQASDREQLDYAASRDRVMVTRNRNDFIQLTVQFFNSLLPHKGVIIVPHTIPGDNFALIAGALKNYASRHPEGMESYTIDFLHVE